MSNETRLQRSAWGDLSRSLGAPRGRIRTGTAVPLAWCVATLMSVAWAGESELLYDAPTACPTREEFLQAVEGLRERSSGGAPLPASGTVRIETVPGGEAWFGSLKLLDSLGAPIHREVRANDCRETFDALALMLAFALDTKDTTSPSPSNRDEPSVPRDEDGTTSTVASETNSSPADRIDASARARNQAREPSPRSESSLSALWPSAPRAPSGESAKQDHWADFRSPPLLPSTVPGWGLGAAASVRSEVSPALIAGAEAVVYYVGPSSWYIRGAFGGAYSGSMVVRDRQASFAWFGTSQDVCLQFAAPFAGCLSSDTGLLAGIGEDTFTTERATTQWRGWAAIGPAARIRVPVDRFLRLELGLAALYTLLRPRFVYGGATPELVHQPEPIALVATIGADHFFGETSGSGSKPTPADMSTGDGRRGTETRLTRD